MIYETLKFMGEEGRGGADPDPLPFKNYGVHTIKPELRPCTDYRITFLTLLNFQTTSKQI